MAGNNRNIIIEDLDLNKVNGGLPKWVSVRGTIVQCSFDCLNRHSDKCNVKNEGMCKYNH